MYGCGYGGASNGEVYTVSDVAELGLKQMFLRCVVKASVVDAESGCYYVSIIPNPTRRIASADKRCNQENRRFSTPSMRLLF